MVRTHTNTYYMLQYKRTQCPIQYYHIQDAHTGLFGECVRNAWYAGRFMVAMRGQ